MKRQFAMLMKLIPSLLFLALVITVSSARGEGPLDFQLTPFYDNGDSSEVNCGIDLGCGDGCDGGGRSRCCSPGTLMQWSYGNSFSGGPDRDEPLVTDRPDFTEASSTVGLGVAQLEFGYTYNYDNSGVESTRAQSFGEPLLRVGILAEWLEFRIAAFPLEERTRSTGVSNTASGVADLYLGFKIAMTPQEGILPEMALIPQMNVPIGSSEFTSGSVEPGINWIYAWEINDFISTGGSTQGNRRIDGATGNAYFELAQSWTVAYSLSDRVGAYTEWFALIGNGTGTPQTEHHIGGGHYINGGFTFLLTDDVQFDIRAGWGLSETATDFFTGTGLSIRF